MLTTIFNVLLIIIGFGLVIVVHELGHFLAARWAGVRVFAFAVGFGGAVCSWRRGLGLRRGSSEPEYIRLLREEGPDAAARLSPTEYRLNWIPFGGYVKMLGQDDLPAQPGGAQPAALPPDSFAAKSVPQRAVIMSAGVFMNLVLAAVLFIIAFQAGLMELSPIIGDVARGSPAERAGLRPGDRVTHINGRPAETFNDIFLAVAMSARDEPVRFTVERDGEPAPLRIEAAPERGPMGLLQVGVGPESSTSLLTERDLRRPDERDAYLNGLQRAGLAGVRPGMTLAAINGDPLPAAAVPTITPLRNAVEASRGEPIHLLFRAPDGDEAAVTLTPTPRLQRARAEVTGGAVSFSHLLGLAPVLAVSETTERAAAAGLRAGDVFARIGTAEWPGIAAGVAEIRAARRSEIDLVVLRDGERIPLRAPVDAEGRIGFTLTDTAATDTLIGSVPPGFTDEHGQTPAAQRLAPALPPGSRVLRIAGEPVSDFHAMRSAARRALAADPADDRPPALELTVRLPGGDEETVTLRLTRAERDEVLALGYEADMALAVFGLAQHLDRAGNPAEAVAKGVRKTHQVIMLTYLTFARLAQGTVPVDQLHGPVGITHVGSRIAERGFVYLIFFLGLISANLAVINFLPLPIVDGGHVVFLIIEAITRRPVSPAVQNAATVVGLVLIGTVFVVVTFNDIARLFG